MKKLMPKKVSMTLALLAGSAIFCAAGLAIADTKIERNGKVYVVTDNAASGVCKSIVRDQPGQLRSALYHGLAPIDRPRAHTFYQCNQLNLLSFAHEVGAENVVGYLAPKFYGTESITTEEVASR